MIQSINRNRPAEAVQSQLDLAHAIAEQQEAIASGKRLTRPSDDPQGWLEISLIARQQGDEAASSANIGRAETRAVQAESSMNELSSGLIRAKELLVLSNNDTVSGLNREGIAIELEGILANFRDILGQDDPYGGKLFADAAIEVPIGGTRNVIASPTLVKLSQGIGDGSGGTTSLESLLQTSIDAVRSGTGALREANLQPLDNALDHMTSLLTEQGVARGRLESARNQFLESRIVLAERRKEIEEVDVSEAITRLQALDISLQAAQAVYAKINQRSLLDYLG
ncbi:flagellin [Novosphingopyxis sp.]|uniref:flagellin n=1 Tax=Novosphingopyxis sp. TaxID=2709690 RepID=UPI003B5C98B8